MNRASITAPLVKSAVFVAVTALFTAILGISIAYSGTSGNVGEMPRQTARYVPRSPSE